MIHPLADVKSSHIGEGTHIWQFCVIFAEAQIGENCNICANVLIENDAIIGNNVTKKSGKQLWEGARIKDNVLFGHNATFTNDLMAPSKVYPEQFMQTVIKTGGSNGGSGCIVRQCHWRKRDDWGRRRRDQRCTSQLSSLLKSCSCDLTSRGVQ